MRKLATVASAVLLITTLVLYLPGLESALPEFVTGVLRSLSPVFATAVLWLPTVPLVRPGLLPPGVWCLALGLLPPPEPVGRGDDRARHSLPYIADRLGASTDPVDSMLSFFRTATVDGSSVRSGRVV